MSSADGVELLRRRPALARRAETPGVEPEPETTQVVVDRDRQFTEFVRAHQGDLLRTAWLLCGDQHQAEEMVQQALVRTYSRWAHVRQRDPLGYTRKALANLRIDSWRRRRREVLVPPEDVAADSVPAFRRPDAAQAAGRTEDRDQLVRALATLTARQRRIVVLRHFLDLSEAEVADDLGVSPGTVKSTASRAMAQLRSVLDAGAPAEPRNPRDGSTR
jgi:RNA polymerase sigma-70 factor (sigma-E family)